MSERVYNVLFLCTGNSARSIIAETLLNAMANGRFHAYSAGSHPSGRINPYVAEYLESVGVSTSGARSKSWERVARAGTPKMDLVITVWQQAAGESCPVWPGMPARAPLGPQRDPGGAKTPRNKVPEGPPEPVFPPEGRGAILGAG